MQQKEKKIQVEREKLTYFGNLVGVVDFHSIWGQGVREAAEMIQMMNPRNERHRRQQRLRRRLRLASSVPVANWIVVQQLQRWDINVLLLVWKNNLKSFCCALNWESEKEAENDNYSELMHKFNILESRNHHHHIYVLSSTQALIDSCFPTA